MSANTHILIALFFSMMVLFCRGEGKTNNIASKVNSNNVDFRIDERTEFFRTILNLAIEDSIDEELRPCQTRYYQRVKGHFASLENHPLIQYLRNHQTIMLDFSTIGLMYATLESFEFDEAYYRELDHYGITREALDSISPLLSDFYQTSSFRKFFQENRSYYDSAVRQIKQQVIREDLLGSLQTFYQSEGDSYELTVFVELTNNANNKAVSFYDHYNPNKRALILANICDRPEDVSSANEVLVLDNDTRGVMYHELSHLFTHSLLKKHTRNLTPYRSLCNNCSEDHLIDIIDHMMVNPLQAVLSQKLDHYSRKADFFLNEYSDVRKDVFLRLNEYDPEDSVMFEEVYADCLALIRQSASK